MSKATTIMIKLKCGEKINERENLSPVGLADSCTSSENLHDIQQAKPVARPVICAQYPAATVSCCFSKGLPVAHWVV